MDNSTIKKGDIVYLKGNINNLAIVLDVIFKKDKEYLTFDRGWKISHSFIYNNKGEQLIFKSDKKEITKQELINNRYEFKAKRSIEKFKKRLEADHLTKISEYKPFYKQSFRKFCDNKNFIKGLHY